MKEEIRKLEKLHEVLGDIVKSFIPNKVISPYPNNTYLASSEIKLRSVEEANLFTLPPEALIYVRGQHSSASYWLLRLFEQDGQRQIDLWRNLDCDGLKAPIKNIISVSIEDGPIWKVERGIIRKGLNSAFPYFDYEKDSNSHLSVCTPETYWMDFYEGIRIVEK